jgi:hypothetical protein
MFYLVQYKGRPEIFITSRSRLCMAKDRLEASTSVVFFKLYILAVTMVDQTERRRQHELVLRENIVAGSNDDWARCSRRVWMQEPLLAAIISPSSSLHSPLSE